MSIIPKMRPDMVWNSSVKCSKCCAYIGTGNFCYNCRLNNINEFWNIPVTDEFWNIPITTDLETDKKKHGEENPRMKWCIVCQTYVSESSWKEHKEPHKPK